MDRVHIYTEQGGFRSVRGCLVEILTLNELGEKSRGKKPRVYVGSVDLENPHDRINRKALWQALRMYDVVGKRLNGIKSMVIKSLVCVRVKGDEKRVQN